MNAFEITSGTIIASDPCYEIPTFCQGTIDNVKKGLWFADVDYVEDHGERIARLKIYHQDSNVNIRDFREMPFVGGVDSGQFGFFDKDFYRNDESAKELEKFKFDNYDDSESGEQWYLACCHLTLGSEQWGVLPNGVVSSSGWGDGSYSVVGAKDDNGEYVAFEVVFIEEYDEYDDEDDEEN